MRRRPLWLTRRLPIRGSEQGATLIYALLFTTVIALVIAAVLGLADANLRATRALRQQAAEAAAAGGAANVAINTLRNSSYNGAGDCLGGALELPHFYESWDGSTVSTRVDCVLDATASQAPRATGAGFALLALPTGGQEGINLKANGGGGMEVHGDVGSRGLTHVDSGHLKILGGLETNGCEISTVGQITDSSGRIYDADDTPVPPDPPGPSPQCMQPADADPNYVLPPGVTPGADGTWTNCNGGLRTFSPGVYDDNHALAALNGNCDVSYFEPGVYWFAFNGEWKTGGPGNAIRKVVAGSLTAPDPSTLDMSTACPSPFENLTPGAGVIFIFGGEAHWTLDKGGQAAVCAPTPQVDGQPPIALWGLKQTVGSIPAQSGCVLLAMLNPSNGACATFRTTNFDSIRLYLNGATYLPRGWVDLDLRGSVQQYIVGGLVVRQFSLFSPANSTLPQPLSSGPLPGGPGGARTVVYLTVYVCPGAATCTAGGSLRLKAKVAIFDPNGAPAGDGHRPITILSWSVQR